MMIDTKLDLNTLIALVGMVGAVFYFIVSLKSDVRALVAELSAIKIDVKKFSELLVGLGRLDERLAGFDRRLGSLERRGGLGKTPPKSGRRQIRTATRAT